MPFRKYTPAVWHSFTSRIPIHVSSRFQSFNIAAATVSLRPEVSDSQIYTLSLVDVFILYSFFFLIRSAGITSEALARSCSFVVCRSVSCFSSRFSHSWISFIEPFCVSCCCCLQNYILETSPSNHDPNIIVAFFVVFGESFTRPRFFFVRHPQSSAMMVVCTMGLACVGVIEARSCSSSSAPLPLQQFHLMASSHMISIEFLLHILFIIFNVSNESRRSGGDDPSSFAMFLVSSLPTP